MAVKEIFVPMGPIDRIGCLRIQAHDRGKDLRHEEDAEAAEKGRDGGGCVGGGDFVLRSKQVSWARRYASGGYSLKSTGPWLWHLTSPQQSHRQLAQRR